MNNTFQSSVGLATVGEVKQSEQIHASEADRAHLFNLASLKMMFGMAQAAGISLAIPVFIGCALAKISEWWRPGLYVWAGIQALVMMWIVWRWCDLTAPIQARRPQMQAVQPPAVRVNQVSSDGRQQFFRELPIQPRKARRLAQHILNKQPFSERALEYLLTDGEFERVRDVMLDEGLGWLAWRGEDRRQGLVVTEQGLEAMQSMATSPTLQKWG